MVVLYDTWQEALDNNPHNADSDHDLAGLFDLVAPHRSVEQVVDSLLEDETLMILSRNANDDGYLENGEMHLLHHLSKLEVTTTSSGSKATANATTTPLHVALYNATDSSSSSSSSSRAIPVEFPVHKAFQVTEIHAPDWNTLKSLDGKDKVLLTALVTEEKSNCTYYLRHAQVLPPFLHKALRSSSDRSPSALLVETVKAIHAYDAANHNNNHNNNNEYYDKAEDYCQGIVAYLWDAAQTQNSVLHGIPMNSCFDIPQVAAWSKFMHGIFIKKSALESTTVVPTIMVPGTPTAATAAAASTAANSTAKNNNPHSLPTNSTRAKPPPAASTATTTTTTATTPKGLAQQEKFRRAWDANFQALVQYKTIHGHCRVPQRCVFGTVRLGRWVRKQRTCHLTMSEERRNRLESLDGWIWESGHQFKLDEKWNEMFERLQRYRSVFGDCRVPSYWRVDQDLANWVFRQKEVFRNNKMNPDRKARLEAIGFSFKIRGKIMGTSKVSEKAWQEGFQKLVQFKEKHHHLLVPTVNYDEDPQLSRFVNKQRRLNRLNQLSDDRKQALLDIGFIFDPKEEKWMNMFNQLKAFKEQYGDLQVPSNTFGKWKKPNASSETKLRMPDSDDQIGLYDWILVQRFRNSNGLLGEKRKALLEEIGFDFTWRKQRPSKLEEAQFLEDDDDMELEDDDDDDDDDEDDDDDDNDDDDEDVEMVGDVEGEVIRV